MKGKVFGRGFSSRRSSFTNERKPKYLEEKEKVNGNVNGEIDELDYEGSNFFLQLDKLLAESDKNTPCSGRKQGGKINEIEAKDTPQYVGSSTDLKKKDSNSCENKLIHTTKMMGKQKPTKQLSIEETISPPS